MERRAMRTRLTSLKTIALYFRLANVGLSHDFCVVKEGELQPEANCQKIFDRSKRRKREVKHRLECHNLDMTPHYFQSDK